MDIGFMGEPGFPEMHLIVNDTRQEEFILTINLPCMV
jgi:hypothetical protein